MTAALDQPHPDRPSHFDEDVNEYAPKNNTDVDYPTEFDPDVKYGFDAPPPAPIPVFITETPPERRVIRRANRGNYTLGGLITEPVMIAGNDLRRKRLVIRNNDADTDVWIFSKRTDGTAAAFRLAFGKDIEEFHNDAVWAQAITGSGDSVVTSLSVLAEIEIDDAH